MDHSYPLATRSEKCAIWLDVFPLLKKYVTIDRELFGIFAGRAKGYLGICAEVVFILFSVIASFTPAITHELSDDIQPGGGASYALAPAA